MAEEPDVFEADVSAVLMKSLTVAGLEEIVGPGMGSMGEGDEELEKKGVASHQWLHAVAAVKCICSFAPGSKIRQAPQRVGGANRSYPACDRDNDSGGCRRRPRDDRGAAFLSLRSFSKRSSWLAKMPSVRWPASAEGGFRGPRGTLREGTTCGSD